VGKTDWLAGDELGLAARSRLAYFDKGEVGKLGRQGGDEFGGVGVGEGSRHGEVKIRPDAVDKHDDALAFVRDAKEAEHRRCAVGRYTWRLVQIDQLECCEVCVEVEWLRSA